jgi:Tol biopolymer transport system component
VAYVADGSLHLLDLSPGRDRILVRKGEAPLVAGPVAFSPDGRWVAFGQGLVVPSAGGSICSPLGRRGPARYASTYSWRWMPDRDILIGETLNRGLIEATMKGRARRLPIRVDSWALDPTGTRVAYGYSPHLPRIQQIRIYDLASDSRRILYRGSPRRIEPPQVAAWSSDGGWVLFWPRLENSASLAADGLPLFAVSAVTARTRRITAGMLVYQDFLTWCGARLVAAVGWDRYVTEGKRIVSAAPSAWRTTTLTTDRSRSWYWPVCSPDAARIAVVSTRSGEEPRFDAWDRSLWILSPGGGVPERLLSTPGFSYENPIWSADGRAVMVVRRESKPRASASLCLACVNQSGSCITVARLGRVGFGYYGMDSYDVDWYQPGT